MFFHVFFHNVILASKKQRENEEKQHFFIEFQKRGLKNAFCDFGPKKAFFWPKNDILKVQKTPLFR